jgi:nucleosome binding factor SPN SPT16 subunit
LVWSHYHSNRLVDLAVVLPVIFYEGGGEGIEETGERRERERERERERVREREGENRRRRRRRRRRRQCVSCILGTP